MTVLIPPSELEVQGNVKNLLIQGRLKAPSHHPFA